MHAIKHVSCHHLLIYIRYSDLPELALYSPSHLLAYCPLALPWLSAVSLPLVLAVVPLVLVCIRTTTVHTAWRITHTPHHHHTSTYSFIFLISFLTSELFVLASPISLFVFFLSCSLVLARSAWVLSCDVGFVLAPFCNRKWALQVRKNLQMWCVDFPQSVRSHSHLFSNCLVGWLWLLPHLLQRFHIFKTTQLQHRRLFVPSIPFLG
jgi:hypothetical protein